MNKSTEYRKKILRHEGLTDLQKKVLLKTLDIPRGEVRSYSWVARQLGRPRACRAVGSALSKNPFAPDVPCHRVVTKSGAPGGYFSGTGLKKDLLEKEGVDMAFLNRSDVP